MTTFSDLVGGAKRFVNKQRINIAEKKALHKLNIQKKIDLERLRIKKQLEQEKQRNETAELKSQLRELQEKYPSTSRKILRGTGKILVGGAKFTGSLLRPKPYSGNYRQRTYAPLTSRPSRPKPVRKLKRGQKPRNYEEWKNINIFDY